jgi:predicted Zn-dependent protease
MPYDTQQSAFYEGRLSDGKTAAAQDVHVGLSPRGLVIRFRSGGSDLIWPYSALTTAEPLSPHAIDALISYSYQPGASLFVPHGQFARALAKAAPHVTTRAARRRAAVPWLWAAVAVVAVAAVISLADLSPARTIAGMMPDRLRNSLGEQTVRTLSDKRRLCEAPEGQRALQTLTERLATGLKEKPHFDVVVVDWFLVNAFATPGDRIILTRGLLEKATSPDEVAGVLAHEMGHATLLHPEASLVRVIGMSAAVELLLGGSGGTLANLGVVLTQLSYTRQAEAEADDEALKLLEQSRISPKGFGDFFRRMSEADLPDGGAKSGGLIDVLRTHPPAQDRIARVDQANSYPATPALSAADWTALRSICADNPG